MKIKKRGYGIRIFGKVKILWPKNLTIGNLCTLNEGVFINARAPITIGDYVRISPYVQLHAGSLNLKQPYRQRGHISKPIVIENGVWICAGAIIIPGVTIGEGAVVGAGAVVTKNVKPFTMVGGNPAKKIGRIEK